MVRSMVIFYLHHSGTITFVYQFMKRLRFLIAFATGALLLVFVCCPVFILMAIAPKSVSRRVIHYLHLFWFQSLIRISGVRFEVHGKGNLPEVGTSVIVVANHQSLADIPILYCSLGKPSVILAKKELTAIPIFGILLKQAGHIIVDRQAVGKRNEVLTQTKVRLEDGFWVQFYPEGTRSAEGGLGRFKTGAFRLSIDTGANVLPVAISGARSILPKKSGKLKTGKITVRIGSLISPPESQGEESYTEFTERTRNIVLEMLNSDPTI